MPWQAKPSSLTVPSKGNVASVLHDIPADETRHQHLPTTPLFWRGEELECVRDGGKDDGHGQPDYQGRQ